MTRRGAGVRLDVGAPKAGHDLPGADRVSFRDEDRVDRALDGRHQLDSGARALDPSWR
jgi:hypothetical protein